jgi:hypothetical protein
LSLAKRGLLCLLYSNFLNLINKCILSSYEYFIVILTKIFKFLQGTEDAESFFPNITKHYVDPGQGTCSGGRPRRKQQQRRPAEPPQTPATNGDAVNRAVEEQEGLISETSRLNIGPSLHHYSTMWASTILCLIMSVKSVYTPIDIFLSIKQEI